MSTRKISLPFSYLLVLFLLLFPLISKSENPRHNTPGGYDYLKKLKGAKRGETVKGLHDLKVYLNYFGYTNYKHTENHTQAEADYFDSHLEAALKTFQRNYRLKPTGRLDGPTVSKMVMPSCGIPDMVNGTNTMRKRSHHHRGGSFHTVSHFAFFPNSPRWPVGQTHLTYGFEASVPAAAVGAVGRAFDQWASATQYFTFSQAQDVASADLKIGFRNGLGDHGEGPQNRFRETTLAHAYPPTDGNLHYNGDQNWSDGAQEGAYDLETVGLHEIGHLLGLGHTDVEGAIMYRYIPSNARKGLHEDDIMGIRALYYV